jgi:hypothetical protein
MNDEAPPGPCTANTDHRLKLYAFAAAAAGVSVLALAQPSDAEIVVTRKTIRVDQSPVTVDLNKDGAADFQFSFQATHGSSSCGCHGHTSLIVDALTGGGIVAKKPTGNFGPYASALVRGINIGPSAHFSAGKVKIEAKSHSYSTFGYDGNWYLAGSNRFLGVKFQIKGKTHYGWIRLTVNVPGNFETTITGYAYETVANKRITAGEAAASMAEAETTSSRANRSLGMLALGAEGHSLWRRAVNSETQPAVVRISN